MGTTVSPPKLRSGFTQIWPSLFFTHSERSYAPLLHYFSSLQRGLQEGLRGLNVFKTAKFNRAKKQLIFAFNDVKLLNSGTQIYILVFLTSDLLAYRSRWFDSFKKVYPTWGLPYYRGVRRSRLKLLWKTKKKVETKFVPLKRYYRWWSRSKKRVISLGDSLKRRKILFLSQRVLKSTLRRKSVKNYYFRPVKYKKRVFSLKYRVFYLFFYFYPLLARLKELLSSTITQKFKQINNAEVFFFSIKY